MSSIFREYDIRGVADVDLPDPLVWALGRALAERARACGEKAAWVGQDVRLSSRRLALALARGLEDGGLEVRLLTPGPTPLLYFAASLSSLASARGSSFASTRGPSLADFPATATGVMVTGSHNPPEYNGFKMVVGGETLHGQDIQALGQAVQRFQQEAPALLAPPQAPTVDLDSVYVDYLKTNVSVDRPLKVVVDAGNGAGGPLACRVYEALGCEVIPLFCEPDGRFPNHHPDPTVPENLRDLRAKVQDSGADLGIGFDGDADRIGAVSSTGRILFGDHLILYFARDILAEVPGATIISEVKSSQVLFDTLAAWGARPIIWKTGHSLIKAKLKETKACLAGEMSGHMFFAHRYLGFDDALYAGARLLEGLSKRPDESLDAFLDSLPPAVNTPELRVDCAENRKFEVVKAFVSAAKARFGVENVLDIDGARVKMHGGWGLMRASNTQPVMVMRFEAPDAPRLRQIRDEFSNLLKEIDSSLQVPQT